MVEDARMAKESGVRDVKFEVLGRFNPCGYVASPRQTSLECCFGLVHSDGGKERHKINEG